MMNVSIWGARGTVPVPGPDTVRYGGNTSCVSLELEDRVLVLDAGSGILNLGTSLEGTGKEIFILVTHAHFDHVQGLPLFGPLYEKNRVVHVLDVRIDDVTWSPARLLDGILFPLSPDRMPGVIDHVNEPVLDFLTEHGFHVARERMHHPGCAWGYRVEHDGEALVYMPDNELLPPETNPTLWGRFTSFCRGADYLLHDAQYLENEIPHRRGWGHSALEDVVRLAIDAEVGHLVLFHHDPGRSDEMLDGIQAAAQAMLASSGIRCTAAREGMQFSMGRSSGEEEAEDVEGGSASSRASGR